MLAQLPMHVQKRALQLLQKDDFAAAKRLCDMWRRSDNRWGPMIGNEITPSMIARTPVRNN